MTTAIAARNRRQFMFAALATSGTALAAAPRTGTGSTTLDLADPRVALRTYVKLRGSTSTETVLQPYEGDIFLVADGKVGAPLCGFRGLQKSTWRALPGGGFEHQDYDVGVYVDYRTREILDQWRNPLTGATVKVYHYRGGPSGARLTPGASQSDPYGGLEGRWSQLGDQLWHTASNWGERPNPMTPEEWPLASSGPTLLGSMSLTFAGRISQLADPRVAQPQTLQFWTNTSAWMPWMEMGQRPGFNLWRWIGAKGTRREVLPDALVTAVESIWPGYVTRDSNWSVPTSGRVDYMRARRGLPLTR